jgi:hypothetical protein
VGGSVGPYGACQFDKSEYHGNYVEKMNLEVYKLYSYTVMVIFVVRGQSR